MDRIGQDIFLSQSHSIGLLILINDKLLYRKPPHQKSYKYRKLRILEYSLYIYIIGIYDLWEIFVYMRPIRYNPCCSYCISVYYYSSSYIDSSHDNSIGFKSCIISDKICIFFINTKLYQYIRIIQEIRCFYTPTMFIISSFIILCPSRKFTSLERSSNRSK